ncbi:MAG: hypothetical protein H6553_12095 [Chitinophagales bacterium]|nr:hypothetical protein [Chitinophagales bacterium]
MKKSLLILLFVIFQNSFSSEKKDATVQVSFFNPVGFRYIDYNPNNYNFFAEFLTLFSYPSIVVNGDYYLHNTFCIGSSFAVGGIKNYFETSFNLTAKYQFLQMIYDVRNKSSKGNNRELYFPVFIGFYHFKATDYDAFLNETIITNRTKVNWGFAIGYKKFTKNEKLYFFGEFGKTEISGIKFGLGYKFNFKK